MFVYAGEAVCKLNSASVILLATCTFGGKMCPRQHFDVIQTPDMLLTCR